MQDEADDKISTYSNVKNFTSETNNDDITTREELKSVQKSIALLRQDIRKILHEELFKFLLLNERNMYDYIFIKVVSCLLVIVEVVGLISCF